MFIRFSAIIFLLDCVSAKSVNLNLLSLNDGNNNGDTRLGDTTDGVVYLYPELRVSFDDALTPLTTLDPIITEPTKRDAASNVTASETSTVTPLSYSLPLSSRDVEYPQKSITSEEDVDFPTDDYHDIECDTEGMCWDHYDY